MQLYAGISCSDCGNRMDVIFTGKAYLCAECLFKHVTSDKLAVVKSAEAVLCNECDEVINPDDSYKPTCSSCLDGIHDYCHDDCYTGCWECGSYPDIVLCDSCLEDRDSIKFNEMYACDGCDGEVTQQWCDACARNATGTSDLAVIGDDGVISFNEIEIDWAA